MGPQGVLIAARAWPDVAPVTLFFWGLVMANLFNVVGLVRSVADLASMFALAWFLLVLGNVLLFVVREWKRRGLR